MEKINTVDKALKRFKWRIEEWREFRFNENDLQAYNQLAEFVDTKNRQQLNDNQLFGKLYIYCFGQFVKFFFIVYIYRMCFSK